MKVKTLILLAGIALCGTSLFAAYESDQDEEVTTKKVYAALIKVRVNEDGEIIEYLNSKRLYKSDMLELLAIKEKYEPMSFESAMQKLLSGAFDVATGVAYILFVGGKVLCPYIVDLTKFAGDYLVKRVKESEYMTSKVKHSRRRLRKAKT